MITKNCINCGSEFSAYPSKKNKKYCSRKCYFIHTGPDKAKNMRSKKKPGRAWNFAGTFIVCVICGVKKFIPPRSIERGQKFCSKKCADIASKTGCKNKPNATMINKVVQYDHIRIVEKIIFRKMSEFEVCHHIDKDYHNNDIDNLIVITRGQHTTLHNHHRHHGILWDKNEIIKRFPNAIPLC